MKNVRKREISKLTRVGGTSAPSPKKHKHIQLPAREKKAGETVQHRVNIRKKRAFTHASSRGRRKGGGGAMREERSLPSLSFSAGKGRF